MTQLIHDRLQFTRQDTYAGGSTICTWNPEDAAFWSATGHRVASRNLWLSVPALAVSFIVWMVWSTLVVDLPKVGFKFTTDQLFWLVALPGLSGATLRIFYSFLVPILGGRNWTVISTASLLLPAAGMTFAVQDPTTPYWVFTILALLSGLGGGNFASSMANINFFYPKKHKGTALGINGGLGNLGVSVVQFVTPLIVSIGFGGIVGDSQSYSNKGHVKQIWLQNAAAVWIPVIIALAIVAYLGMNNLSTAKASFRTQSVIFHNKHTWLLCLLYTATFGSFIGYAAGFPLILKTQFVGIDPLKYAFLGPLVGALTRPMGGWLADKWGGAKVTLLTFIAMSMAAAAVILALAHKDSSAGFWVFFASFMLLFAATGIGNGSVFRMVPVIFTNLHQSRVSRADAAAKDTAMRAAASESAAVIGFTSAIAAYGAFFIPKSFGWAIHASGSPVLAIVGFVAFYISAIAVTWSCYSRRGAPNPC